MIKLLFKALICLVLILPFALVSCEKETTTFGPKIGEYYTESCNLSEVTTDSVQRFTLKVIDYTEANPEAKDHPKYPLIIENIKSALKIGGITIDPDWGGAYNITF